MEIPMSELRGLENMGSVLNAPYLGAWPSRIGAFIINFGSIELITYQQLKLLEASHDDFLKNLDRLFGRRVDRLVTLMPSAAKLRGDDVASAIQLWERARDLSHWRNRIAHNPVLPTWKPGSDANQTPPDVLGIPDFQQIREGSQSDTISLELIDKLIDDAARLGQELISVSGKIRGTN